MYNINSMSQDEITEAINSSDFLLYGNYRKEKKKLLNLFKGDYDLLGILTSCYGNRVLKIRIWNTNPKSDDDDIYWIYSLEY